KGGLARVGGRGPRAGRGLPGGGGRRGGPSRRAAPRARGGRALAARCALRDPLAGRAARRDGAGAGAPRVRARPRATRRRSARSDGRFPRAGRRRAGARRRWRRTRREPRGGAADPGGAGGDHRRPRVAAAGRGLRAGRGPAPRAGLGVAVAHGLADRGAAAFDTARGIGARAEAGRGRARSRPRRAPRAALGRAPAACSMLAGRLPASRCSLFPRTEASMRVVRALLVVAVASAVRTPYASSADAPLRGFGADAAARQREREKRFDAGLDAANLRAWMKRLAARPHHVGSPYGKEDAEFIAAQFKSWSYDTAIEEFRVLFPTPRTRLLEMTAPTRFRAALAEATLPEDATSGQTAEQLPVYNAYSIDADVEGPLAYVTYVVPRDYEELERRGVDVKGKVVIARYGGSWRGIKPKVAAEHGAVGCLIYSDPRDDGYFEGDVYPKGPWRNEKSAQRGSVAD